ncbi:hypothetical protein M9458_007414, partial [Cirrhinus mrigala]
GPDKRGADGGAQHLPASGGSALSDGAPEQGAEAQTHRAGGNRQEQIQGLHRRPGGQDRPAGGAARHRDQ